MKTLILILLFTFTNIVNASNKPLTAPKENIFRVSIQAKITSLDPHVTNDVYSSQMQNLFYESLYQYHYLKRPFELDPLLASELPKYSKDGKTLTIKLKKGVKFHDDACFASTQGKGKELTAEDVKYTLERITGPKFTSPAYGSLEGKLVGVEEFHTGKAKEISGVKVVDPYTIEMKLTNRYPRFVYNFVGSGISIVAKECVEKLGDGFARHPVGTGPYIPKYLDLNSKIIAIKNPNYREEKYPSVGAKDSQEKGLLTDAGKRLPLNDGVNVEIVAESQPRWLKFMNGETEMMSVPKDNFQSALPNGQLSEELKAKGISLHRSPTADVTVQIFNMKDPVYGKNKDVRHAIALAIDVNKFIEIMYVNQATRAQSIIDPTQWGYDPKFKSKWSEYNVAKAKELLAKAGYPDGKGLPPFSGPTGADSTARQFDELFTKQMAAIGVKYVGEPMTWPELDRRARAGNFVVLGIGYASGVPDVEDSLSVVQTKGIATGSNAAFFSNAELDKIASEIETLPNGPERMKKVSRFREIMDDEMPMIPMVHRIGNQLVQSWVKNHVFTDAMFLGNFIKYNRVETSK